jgi:predicted metal-dependent hydrolase
MAAIYRTKLPEPRNISVRKMRRRWGTCHSNGNIWFNRELIKRDPELIDYVIIHELCHLVHHNHGREYYELLGSIIPEFRKLRQRLRN